MYFFMIIFFFMQLDYGISLKHIHSPGKYQTLHVENMGICSYNYLMSSATYIDMSGIDHRYPYIENDSDFAPRFVELIHKQNLLQTLQNKNESIIKKHTIAEEYNENEKDIEYETNILAGGLLVDWEADII